MTTPIAGIPELLESQYNKHLIVNQALRMLEAIALGAIVNRTTTTPPGNPAEGALYIPATGAVGAWFGLDNKIVQWSNGVWLTYHPWVGARLWDNSTQNFIHWTGVAWQLLDFGNVGDMRKSTYDTNNNGVVDNAERLAAQLPSFYLDRANHIGGIAFGDVAGLGTAATRNAGSSANQVLLINADGKLPTIDGSNLINLPTGTNLTLRELDGSPLITNVNNIAFNQAHGFTLTNNGSGSVTLGFNIAVLGLMTKSIYDPNDDGKINAAITADGILGVESAVNNSYYGTDAGGAIGFHVLPSGGGGGSSAAFEGYEEVLTADKVLATTDKPYLYFDPNGANRVVYLPTTPNQNQFFRIRSDNGAYTITVNDGGGAIAFLGNEVNNGNGLEKRLMVDCHYVGTTWRINIY